MNRDEIIACLNLHAVLPQLAALVRLDDDARKIATGLDLAVRFRVHRGPSLRLTIRKGEIESSPEGSGLQDLVLLFLSNEALNRSFSGQKATPIPLGALWKLGSMRAFTRLTGILSRYLKPEGEDLSDPAFRARSVELQLLCALYGVSVVAQNDPLVGAVLGRPKDGTVLIEVLPRGPRVHVEIRNGAVRVKVGSIPGPDATITLDGVETAAALLLGELDLFAAIGARTVRISGLLTLADEVNWMMDRVGSYLV